jgi:TonB family protein
MITIRPRSARARRALAFSSLALVLAAAAFLTRDPLSAAGPPPAPPQPPVSLAEEPLRIELEPKAVSASTPEYTEPPRVLNENELAAALEGNYPAALRAAGVRGSASVWFYVNEAGEVTQTLLDGTSGNATLDAAALRVAPLVRFSAARNQDRPVKAWVSLPIEFSNVEIAVPPAPEQPQPLDASAVPSAEVAAQELELRRREREMGISQQLAGKLRTQGDATLRSLNERSARLLDAGPAGGAAPESRAVQSTAEGDLPLRLIGATVASGREPAWVASNEAPPPTFTPYTEEPRIRNTAVVARALQRESDAARGLEGEAQVRFYVDAKGRVVRTVLAASSGDPRVDAAALRVAAKAQFHPARNSDRPVAVWVSVPFRFGAK